MCPLSIIISDTHASTQTLKQFLKTGHDSFLAMHVIIQPFEFSPKWRRQNTTTYKVPLCPQVAFKCFLGPVQQIATTVAHCDGA